MSDDYEKRTKYGVAINAAIRECVKANDTTDFQKKVDVWHEKVKAAWATYEQRQQAKEMKFFD